MERMQCKYIGKYRSPNDEEDFERIARLKGEKVKEKVSKGDFNFEGVKLLKFDFSGIKIGGDVDFGYAESNGDIWLRRAEIKGEVRFYRAKINGDIRFNGTKIKGAIFEKLGGREGADYHFYREIEAKRLMRKLGLEKLIDRHTEFLEKERRIYWGFLELPVQYIQLLPDTEVIIQNPDFIKDWQASRRYLELLCGLLLLLHSQGNI